MVSRAFKARAANDGDLVAREVVAREQFPDLQLHQLEQLLIVHHVDLVQEHHHGRHFHLAGEQDVLSGLGHRPIRGTDHQDRPIHLGGAGDHVLDVVGVPRAVHMGVVALLGLVLDVGNGNGDAPLALLGRLVDVVKAGVLGQLRRREHLGDRRRQRRLPMVNVPDRPHIHMRLVPHKLLLRP